jgi:hypothetical protein
MTLIATAAPANDEPVPDMVAAVARLVAYGRMGAINVLENPAAGAFRVTPEARS